MTSTVRISVAAAPSAGAFVPLNGADDSSLREKPKMELLHRTQAHLCAPTGELFRPELAVPTHVDMTREQLMYETRVRPLDTEQRNNIQRQLVTCAVTGRSYNSASAEEQARGKVHTPLPNEVTERPTPFNSPKKIKDARMRVGNFRASAAAVSKVEQVENMAPTLQKLQFSTAYAWDTAVHAADMIRQQTLTLLKKVEEAKDLATAKSAVQNALTEEQYEWLQTTDVAEFPDTEYLFLQNAVNTGEEIETPAERVTRTIAVTARDISVTTWAKAEAMLLPDLPAMAAGGHTFEAIPADDMHRTYSARKANAELEKIEKQPFKKSKGSPQKKHGGGWKPGASQNRDRGQSSTDTRPSALDRVGDKPKWVPSESGRGRGRSGRSSRGGRSPRGGRKP